MEKEIGRIPGYEQLQEHKDFFIGRLKHIIRSGKSRYQVETGKKATDEDLAELGGISRNTLRLWLQGKMFPQEQRLIDFCVGLGFDPLLFADPCSEQYLTKEERSIVNNQYRAEELGIIESFVRFLHDDYELHGRIADLIEQSEDGYTGVQFSDPLGKKMYPDRRTALVIKYVQNETAKLISERIKEICLISNTFQNAELFERYLEQISDVSEMEDILAPFVDEESALENVIWDKGEDEDGHA